MKLHKAIILLIMAFMAGSAISFLAYSFYYIDGSIEYDAKIAVNDHIGVAADTDTINFGMIVPGTSSSRRLLNLMNNNDYPLNVEIRKTGNISGWINSEDITEKRIYLDSNENRTVYLTAKVPENTPYGDYNGKIKFVFRKAFI